VLRSWHENVVHYTTAVNGNFGVRLMTEDLDALLRGPDAVADLQRLLDRHLVLVLAPQKEMTKPTFGTLALGLGFPHERRHRSFGPPGANGTQVAGYEFVADFGAAAKPVPQTAREPSYIESLHYDGISAYSMQANFHVPETTPNLWCDMRSAYRELPTALRTIVDTHCALHAVVPSPRTPLTGFPEFDVTAARRHALVIKHPRTSEPLLYLPKNPASRIEGMPEDEGRSVLRELWEFVSKNAARYEARIQHNELVVWDGLGTVHTNPAYPRDRDRTVWFLVVPGKSSAVEPYFTDPSSTARTTA
jgi:alpha-ketoglutarate-dependent taurine dioxygenase